MSIAYKSPMAWCVRMSVLCVLGIRKPIYQQQGNKSSCLVPLQIPTVITPNPTAFPWSCPSLKNCAELEGSPWRNCLMPFWTNSFGDLDIVRISTGLAQIPKLFEQVQLTVILSGWTGWHSEEDSA